VGTADNRPALVNRTAFIDEKRARTVLWPLNAPGKNRFYFSRQIFDCPEKIGCFDGKERQMQATAATSGSTGYLLLKLFRYLPAELIYTI